MTKTFKEANALAQILVTLKTHPEYRSMTDVDGLANMLRAYIPSLTHSELVQLIEDNSALFISSADGTKQKV